MSGDIHFEVRGRAAIVTLDKQATLNAVTGNMLHALEDQLELWRGDSKVERVIIKAAPGRAFSAGGDIRHLYDEGTAGRFDYDFFAHEYTLNAKIHHYPKPYIALIDGIVMGGGVGVSINGSHKVAGDNIAFAMPEVGIGFFPDVGGSYLLSRMPGRTGLYMGLTGSRMKQADCLWSGIATHACSSDQLVEIEGRLCEAENITDVLADTSTEAEPGPIGGKLGWIDEYFDKPGVTEIVRALEEALDGSGEEKTRWAEETLSSLHQKSPVSLKIAFRQITKGATLTFNECMRMEYRILKRILPGQEFYEGIRAAIIEKDGKPDWKPPRLADVDAAMIERHFELLDEDELDLEGIGSG